MHDMLDELYEISLDKEFQIGAEFEYQHAVMFSGCIQSVDWTGGLD